MITLAVVILTRNEAVHIGRAIGCIKSIASEIFVVDSQSTDGTAELAAAEGAIVVQHAFVNQARQFQWALDTLPISADWVMRLDADEIIEPDLAAEIAEKLPQLPPDVNGINLKRKHIFLGRWIRHGGRYPLILLRIWRRGTAIVEDRWMDEHIFLKSGASVTFAGGFADHNLGDLSAFITKHNAYATREAVQLLLQKRGTLANTRSKMRGTSQAAIKRRVKESVYDRLPSPVAALGYFLYRYFLQLGFLDGREGLIYHVLQGFWYRFLVGAKLLELERALRNVDNRRLGTELSRATGLKLEGSEAES